MAKVLCFDIDGTLTEEDKTAHDDLAGSYIYRRPNLKVRDFVLKAYDAGWYILLFTGRREAQRRITEDWLHSHGFHYHALEMGKPYYTYCLDDRGRTLEELEEIVNHGQTSNDPCCSGDNG